MKTVLFLVLFSTISFSASPYVLTGKSQQVESVNWAVTPPMATVADTHGIRYNESLLSPSSPIKGCFYYLHIYNVTGLNGCVVTSFSNLPINIYGIGDIVVRYQAPLTYTASTGKYNFPVGTYFSTIYIRSDMGGCVGINDILVNYDLFPVSAINATRPSSIESSQISIRKDIEIVSTGYGVKIINTTSPVRIYDTTGRVVYSHGPTNSLIVQLRPGVYFVRHRDVMKKIVRM
ncbi:MAG: hypothetical protein A2268_00955 [Candidatus Raymondbacteria bacterium RifOxyA12_full_50_37]|uniref:Secretion system C-terminal sorting domain-containing protein n=1 Tax=Candidatus Raymondbacteria bacterium RIFOXYD12_FULL_49_13 TaxID=1817890 RepID=A0A1F7FFV5_UNCRA|nr:MAG: hypothetical protein A2268_00955 [Candidatus Raymondbacteria bacterium RifOxyA12_full_50_37]OGJ86372.1 MAG: hypothetical protein A2248_13920 [Candidatus Raymondbacteria bacterium RIFOXYA2_FULL_49_16]OGJ95542.1 MAG: hypothetical protein A2453_12695 [Candidatus Raymondbacteria bacterium RIFOXYC2_FULL_50_21]OGJ96097.1 MAG: hypothetical protein A2487_01690 [Candidatus Raymondbacteria bacterium RifOxyC12_full_50_8]OGK04523.1 MAG: hypothetical protein A2350_18005 [Candidatus Raymondbacteria b